MKLSLIAFLVFISIGFKGFADCLSNRLSVFPSQREIKKSSLFVLEGYARSQTIITSLNSQYRVYLKCGNKQIPLEVVEVHAGQYNLTQALLKPEEPLIAGKEYKLIIDNLPTYERFGNYNSKIKKYEPIIYSVKDETDTEDPKWIQIPQEKDKSLQHFGCGPEIHVNFKLEVREQSDFLIKTTLKSVETGKETTYYIKQGKETISIGHDMCSGAFNFEEGMNYQAKFAIMDASGNVSEETEWIAFTKPE